MLIHQYCLFWCSLKLIWYIYIFSNGFLDLVSGLCQYVTALCFDEAWLWFCWYINNFKWTLIVMLQINVNITTLSSLFSLQLIVLIDQQFSTAFLDVASGICSYVNTILVYLEVNVVDSSTFSTGFLDLSSGIWW